MSGTNGTQQKEKAAKVRRRPERDPVLTAMFAASRRDTSGTLLDRHQQGSGLLQRQCACGFHTIAGGEYDACRKKRESSFLQRTAINNVSDNAILSNPAETSTFPKLNFAQDFSRIPTHTTAPESIVQTKQQEIISSSGFILQRTLDPRATAIVRYAQNTSILIAERAVNVVRRIIRTYYASQASLVADVVYSSGEAGLVTSCATFPDAQGTITVGDYFLNHTTERGLARRVLQVDHELEHIRQQRRGMGGPHRRHLREFLAFAREALASEAPGTGTMRPLMRSTLIDAALRNYCDMNDAQQSAQETKQVRLLEARTRYQSRIRVSRRTPPPTCSD